MSEEERKRRAEEKKRKEDGERSPEDRARDIPEGKQKDGAEQPDRPDDVPAWVAMLPPEIRDAIAGGEAEKIPSRYRHLIQRYNLWLQKRQKNENR